MRILIILAHPHAGSFNHAVAETAVRAAEENGHEPIFHDLYLERFDPLLQAGELAERDCADESLLKYCRELRQADGIIFIHPNWWGQPPAILKGWIDRVLRPGVAYRFEEGDSGEGVPIGLLANKAALVFNTSDTPMEREKTCFGDPLDLIWKKCIFEFCGIKRYARKTFSVVVTSSPEQRRMWLEEAGETVKVMFPSD